MPRFFSEQVGDGSVRIEGQDAAHISKVLRMKTGDTLVVCDCKGSDHFCKIIHLEQGVVKLAILRTEPSASEPSVSVTLYQALPKSDKMDLIVQKCVELGVKRIVPVITSRCVSRPDGKAIVSKVERWNKIAVQAAKQSGRGILPAVEQAYGFRQALGKLASHESGILFYEQNGGRLSESLKGTEQDIGIFVGPEGGFEQEETDAAAQCGIAIAGLAPRILRTETAPLCALSAIMFATGNI
ncbi:MAG TPA: 16S rRNA (uracil(1498)-N(3))-methyltransferase [Clostridia bacterium]|nr:16S rRNA (uracil(1498)-N(3))-methyltransferase [Clostridia bacterium]